MRHRASVVLLGLLGVACATTDAQKGRSGPVLWEVLWQTQADQGYTLVLRETTGLGIQFTTVRTAIPLPPTAHGREYYGGIEEAAFVRRLEPLGELRVDLRRLFVPNPPQYVDLDFRGVDDRSRDVRVTLRVYKR